MSPRSAKGRKEGSGRERERRGRVRRAGRRQPGLLASFGHHPRLPSQEVNDQTPTPGPKLTDVFSPLPQLRSGKETLALRVLPFYPRERWGAAV